MKKVLNTIMIVLISVSCAPKDKNLSIVRKEFKTYVQKTFNDPNSLKEIVEITPHDTISLESIRALINITNDGIEQFRGLWELTDSLNTARIQADLNGPKPKRQPSYSESVQGAMLINDVQSLMRRAVEAKIALISTQLRLKELEAGLEYHPAIYVYEVKYRNQQKDGLKLESAFAYIDSLAGFKVIIPELNHSDIISNDYYNAFKLSNECLNASNKVQEIYEKQKVKLDELMEFTQRFK